MANAARIERLAAALREEGLQGYLCASAITLGYLSGFHEAGGERFLMLAVNADGRTRLICPGLSAAQARRCGLEDIHAWDDGEDPLALVERLATDWKLREGRLAVDNDMGAWQLLALQRTLPHAAFIPGHGVLSQLMRRKDARELAHLGEAGRIADEAFLDILLKLEIGMTERAVAELTLATMARLGGAPTFCIAATGANSAEPHHHSDASQLTAGDVLILDFGCSVEGYQSDITRTVCLGPASDEVKAVYRLVHEAHVAGRHAVHSGTPCQEVDRAARQVIERAGYGRHFMHRTGHGIGLRGHEEPYLIEGNGTPLAVGECFSVEPGIYLPGRFGIRIENCVTCTADGHRSLNAEPSGAILEVG